MRSERNGPKRRGPYFGFSISKCSSTPVGFVQRLLNKEQCDHPSHAPDLLAADFYLLLRLKSALKGRRFCNATDVIVIIECEIENIAKKSYFNRRHPVVFQFSQQNK
jgi:hypothetical protein